MNAKEKINTLRLILKADKRQILAGFLLFSVSFFTVLAFFPANSSADSQYHLNITKTARNVSRNDNNWQNEISANAGDRVAFSIRVDNNSGYNAYNVFVSDNLPSQLTYASGSTRIDGNYAIDGIVYSGINIGSINSGQSKTITFDAYVSTGLSTGTSFINYAYARADNMSQQSDSAQIWIGNIGTGNPYLRISKTGRNISRNESSWQETIYASPGDRIAFSLQVSTTNNTQATNAVITDTLPYQLSYVSGSSRIDGAYTALDNIVSSGLFIGTITAGQTKNITFEATVNSSYSYNANYTFTNYAYARADNASQTGDSAQISINSDYNYNYNNQYPYQYPYNYPYQYNTSGYRNFTISINNNGFYPSTLTVRKGDKITFINNDSTNHTVSASALGGQHYLSPGQSYILDTSYLNTVQYDFQCDFYPWMKGSILVMEQAPLQIYQPIQTTQPTQPLQQQQQQIVIQEDSGASVKAITGANNFIPTGITAATLSGLAVVSLYFLMLNIGWLAKLKLKSKILLAKIA